jgi:hypothetical protein
LCEGGEGGAAEALTADDFVVVSGPASPRVAYAVRRTADALQLTLDVATFAPDGSGAAVQAGFSAARKVVLDEQKAAVEKAAGLARFVFTVPAKELAETPEDWRKLRLGLAVRWTGGANGEDRQRERFSHVDRGAPHAGLSPRPEDWDALDLDEYAHLVADRKARIVIPFTQPMDGKATVVIEEPRARRRVRNLLSGAPRAKGAQALVWDGLDDDGQLVQAGTYRWRSIHHPGVTPEYLMSFCNGDEKVMFPIASNHQHFVAAGSNAKYVFFAAAMTEGGFAMMAVDHQGAFQHGYNPIMGSGMDGIAVAADEKFLYAAHDGEAWGQHLDRKKPDWKGTVSISLTRFDIESTGTVDFPGGQRFVKLEAHDCGPGAGKPALKQGGSLTGMALLDGKLYLGSRNAEALLVVDAKTAKQVGSLPLPAPGPVAASKDGLFAFSGTALLKVDPATGKSTPVIAADQVEPRGLAVDEQGLFYVSDGKTHTVKVFDAQGKLARTIGKPGGPYQGAYDPERMVAPTGVTAAGGRLWVAEDRWNPKRALAWDLAANKIVVQKYGNPAYGGPSAGFDTQDPTLWLGLGCSWKVDFARQTAVCQSVLGAGAGEMHYKILHQDGRTFVIGLGGYTAIYEFLKDATLKPLALVGSTHRYCFAHHWRPPEVFVVAFNKACPERAGKHADKGPGVLWVDLNGDGAPQAEEFQFSTASDNFAGGYWGHDFHDLTLRVPATVKGKRVLVTLQPDGYLPGGAPKYPDLNAACLAGVPVELEHNEVETAVDRFGDVIANTDPWMKAFAPDGRLLWRYANRWSNVHGSHAAPLPETGVMQGCLFFQGVAPLDEKSDVFIMNGNHGRFFVLTSDGLYLDEMFKDVRLGGSRDAYWIGGECFGGYFAKAEKDGAYYLQTGGNGYRIFRIHGLQEARRAEGEVKVAPEQLASAERNRARKLADEQKVKEALLPLRGKPIAVDGQDAKDWGKDAAVAWDRSGRFPVKVKCDYDAENLYLLYSVEDDSPWVNNGKDWTALFKSGDSVDLQLGTDPGAPEGRRGPAPGDLRLLIAPFEGQPLAVLYRHRVPGAKNPVTFTCPWRSETVDVVQKLERAKIAVQKEANRYRVEAAIPLADLGLKDPGGKTFKADFGVIYGDPEGTVNVLRSYWSNQATGLVNDVPGEIMLSPHLWGRIRFEGR